jgi:hypothetical protein
MLDPNGIVFLLLGILVRVFVQEAGVAAGLLA